MSRLFVFSSMDFQSWEYEKSRPSKCKAVLEGNCIAQPSMRRARLIVRLAGLVERLAADAVEAQFRRPGQHQRTAARVAVQALERQALQHGLPAAGTDRERAQRVGVLHDGVLGGIGPQACVLWRVDPRVLQPAPKKSARLLALFSQLP